MSRGKGARKPCDLHEARQRLVDARQFLEATVQLAKPLLDVEAELHDVAV